MTVDPIIVAAVLAAMGAMGGLFLLLLRKFSSGEIMPRNTVPRETYDAQVAIVASYAEHLKELTGAVKALTGTVDRVVPPNGGK